MKTLMRENMKVGKLAEQEQVRKRLGEKLVTKWQDVKGVGEGLKDMHQDDPKRAENCSIILENQQRWMKGFTEATTKSQFNMTPHQILKVIRLGYPNSVRGDIFWDIPMASTHQVIFYLSPTYNSALRGSTKDAITHESATSRFATEFVEEETTLQASNITSTDTVTITTTSGDPRPIRPLSVTVLYQDASASPVQYVPIATDDGNGNLIGIGTALDSTATNTVNYTTGSIKFDLDLATPLATDKVLLRFAYDSEDVDNYDQIGEINLKLVEHYLRAHPTPLKISWSVLADLHLHSSLGVDAGEALVTGASEEIRKTLDFQALTISTRYARNNTAVAFNASTSAGEGEVRRAAAIGRSLTDAENVVYNATQRGGNASVICGTQAQGFFELHPNWIPADNQKKVGIYKIGMLRGHTFYKAPNTLVAKNKAHLVFRNADVDGDAAIVFGTFAPLYHTQELETSDFVKSRGVAHFGDSKVLQSNYMVDINFSGL